VGSIPTLILNQSGTVLHMPMPSKGVRIQCTTRIPTDVHRAAVAAARQRGWTLNDFLVSALRAAVDDGDIPDPIGVRQNLSIYDDEGNKIGVV
jgi:hypothetical protein